MAFSIWRNCFVVLGIVLLFSIIISQHVAIAINGHEPQLSIKDLFADLASLIQAGDFEGAAKRLEGVDIDSMFRKSSLPEKTQTSDRRSVVFLGYAEYAFHIPGIPSDLKAKTWRRKNFLEVPGTGDDLPLSDGQLRRRWFDVVGSFVLKFNTRTYREGVALGDLPALPLTATAVRRILLFDEDTWNRLPIEVQVTLEILVNDRQQRDVDDSPSNPEHGHSE